jgi:hypothetical protein
MAKSKIIVTAWHPSAANSVVPVIKRLRQEEKTDVVVLGTKYSSPIFEKNKLAFTPIEQYQQPDFSSSSMEQLLQTEDPDLIIAGASFQEPQKNENYVPDQTILQAAKRLQTPSLRVQDWWSPATKYDDVVSGKKMAFLPDKIALMDDYVRQKMIALGFPEALLEITGSPELDELANKKKSFTPEKRKEILGKLGIENSAPLLFYAGSIDWTKNLSQLGYWNLDHFKIFGSVLKSLSGIELNLLLGMHPRIPDTDKILLNEYLQTLHDDRIIPVYGLGSKGLDSDEVSLAADLTMTSFSTVGVKSAYMGRPSMSLQPNLIWPSNFQDGEVGFFYENQDLIPLGTTYAGCENLFRRAIIDPDYLKNLETKLSNSKFNLGEGKATKNVVNLAYKLMK